MQGKRKGKRFAYLIIPRSLTDCLLQVRSVPVLTRWRPGSWRSTKVKRLSEFCLINDPPCPGELCVFSELGWLDNSGNWSEAASEADLATLSPNVTAVLSEENMQQCMEMVMEEMAEDKIVKKCVVNGKGKYSDEELAKLEELATATAGIQCFLHMFQVSLVIGPDPSRLYSDWLRS